MYIPNKNANLIPHLLRDTFYINGLVQDCSIFSALAMEILQFCTKPSIEDCDFVVILVQGEMTQGHCIRLETVLNITDTTVINKFISNE